MKKKISSFIIYAGFLTSLLTTPWTVKSIEGKKQVKLEYETKIEEYYDELNKINEEKLKEQQIQYQTLMKEYEEQEEKFVKSTEVKIPNDYKNKLQFRLKEDSDYAKYGIITQRDLSNLKNIDIKINKNSDVDFLKYCINLEEATISCDASYIYKLNNIPVLPNVKKIKFKSTTIETFNQKIAETIYKKFPALEELSLPDIPTFEPGIIESMTNLKKLEINPYTNCDIDFKKLDYLEELSILSNQPYDIAIWFNNDEYNYLKEQNVKVTFISGMEEKYTNVSNKVDEIIKKLEINDTMTDEEILEKVMEYAVQNYKYDSHVKIATEREIISKNLCGEFYKGGDLYAALENKTQICGNYAAVLEAVYDRLQKPEKAYLLISDNHAWNLIDIDGKKYYVDATWVDDGRVTYGTRTINAEDAIKKGVLSRMDWYKEEPIASKIKLIDCENSHVPTNLVEYEGKNYKQSEFKYETEQPKTINIKTLEKPVMKLDVETPDTKNIDKEYITKQLSNDAKILGNVSFAIAALTILIIKKIRKQKTKTIK